MKAPAIHADRASITQCVERCAQVLLCALSPTATHQLVQWIELIVAWNRKIDLTAARSLDELVDLCVADAMALSRGIEVGRRVIDVGSGAGAPGLPLCVIRPDLEVSLVEPLAKRVSFLRTCIGTLGLAARVHRAHGASMIDAGPWDVVISRATLEPAAWLQLGLQLCKVSGGKVAVMLARRQPPESDSVAMCEFVSYTWPLTGAKRNIAWYEKNGSSGIRGR